MKACEERCARAAGMVIIVHARGGTRNRQQKWLGKMPYITRQFFLVLFIERQMRRDRDER